MPEDRWVKLPFQRGVPYHGSATALAATRRLREVIAHDLPWEDRIAVSMYEQAGEFIKSWEELKDMQIRLRSRGKNLSRVDQRNMGFYHWSAERILLMAIDWVLEKEEHDNRVKDAINREQARIRRQRGAQPHQLGPILVNRGAQPE
ncbi:uncharacterized protein LDX57_010364 [Aspergillus melleus]|uniref:uncharacterized protein n=1 Tax=Aspergillus melleus TaxID=138277 RepID=UPI001E8CAE5A|nr:uncharacterized protein LDX57_010364 [Aspergillus melleus]KAH8432736.1 hypothetical protein LDX57_010364 [Aspergillus melleus]